MRLRDFYRKDADVIEYVAGFLVNRKQGRVLLVEKQKPLWQEGLFNAVGGKIKYGERSVDAMRREFREEAGLDVACDLWWPTVILQGHDFNVRFYVAEGCIEQCSQCEAEPLWSMPIESFGVLHRCVHNVRWILPMSMDKTVKFPVTIEDLGNVDFIHRRTPANMLPPFPMGARRLSRMVNR